MIKRLTEEHLDFISSIDVYGFSDGWNKNMLKSAISSGNFSGLMYYENGEPLAFITYSVAIDTADIEEVFCLPKCRNKGIAKTLINAASAELKDMGVKKLFLEVKLDNIPAIKLYESLNFVNISIRKKYYKDGKDALVYKKEL